MSQIDEYDRKALLDLYKSLKVENVDLQSKLEDLQKKYDNVIRELCDAARDELDRRDYVNKLVQENKNLKASLHDAANQGGDSG